MFTNSLWLWAFWLTILSGAFSMPQLTTNISAEEAAALEGIVEDDPTPAFRKGGSLSPSYPSMFKVALPIPPVKEPKMTITNPVTGKDIRYYEITITPFTQSIYPNLQRTKLVGYDGIAPGPTLLIPKGTEAVVRFINNATAPNSVHLHGSYSRAPWDGWAEDTTQPGQYKDYYYPNTQSARTLWYHDHAMSITAENAYMGQAGTYLISDPAESALGLPSGYGKFDIPLILTSKQYNSDGTLKSTNGETDSLWGDVIHVNGQPWPFMNVQPRKYRFRFLDASVSRSFALYFALTTAVNNKLPFKVIGSDAGLLDAPKQVSDLYLAMAERYEVVFDFSSYAGKTIELRNLEKVGDVGTDDDYENTDKVMRFVVASKLDEPDTSVVPSTLRTLPFPPATNQIKHHFRFHRSGGEWRINDVGFADVQNRMLANVPLNTVEIWELENSSGGWTHPIHIHLVDFRVLSRTKGKRGVMPYESGGLKDVVWLAKGETVQVEAHYAPWPGVYMFHCHNLIHEDHDMMAAFNVTVLPEFGYNSTSLIDPMESRWRAKPYTSSDVTGRTGPFSDQAIIQSVQNMANYKPYVQPQALMGPGR